MEDSFGHIDIQAKSLDPFRAVPTLGEDQIRSLGTMDCDVWNDLYTVAKVEYGTPQFLAIVELARASQHKDLDMSLATVVAEAAYHASCNAYEQQLRPATAATHARLAATEAIEAMDAQHAHGSHPQSALPIADAVPMHAAAADAAAAMLASAASAISATGAGATIGATIVPRSTAATTQLYPSSSTAQASASGLDGYRSTSPTDSARQWGSQGSAEGHPQQEHDEDIPEIACPHTECKQPFNGQRKKRDLVSHLNQSCPLRHRLGDLSYAELALLRKIDVQRCKVCSKYMSGRYYRQTHTKTCKAIEDAEQPPMEQGVYGSYGDTCPDDVSKILQDEELLQWLGRSECHDSHMGHLKHRTGGGSDIAISLDSRSKFNARTL